ncbi:mechanosensitive ion channel family protein [Natronolimnobius sp. AArcel1]|uniref:mechanosensitive ion channel family protein n=1 Tax=Natronolimnobius sp. AArcel1 TaxID=1679093 RepID=UPI0013EB6738|nr:mechanosensitive ion channel family protein [Natronolimnobius sp. AArcel1]NGM69652.1 mechanosensitive ion channel family protein [Natronolimnobius sp. AArcel1]
MDLGVLDFNWLAGVTESTEQKVAVTLAAAGLLLIVLFTYRRLQSWVSDRTRPLYGDIASTIVLIGTCLVSFSIVVGVWEWTDEVQNLSDQHDIGGEVIAQAIVTFILAVGALIVTRFIKRMIDEVFDTASTVTDHQREISQRISQVIIWSVALIIILSVWVEDLGGLLVGAGFLGIVVGMAAQQVLGTILAGFVLMFARPFEIGDWVEVEGQQGIVTDISIINTRIRSFDGEYIMVPNDVISSEMVTNRSRFGRLRVEVDVGIDYESDVERAAELAADAVSDLEDPLSAPGAQVITKEFGDSAVVLGVRFWIDSPNARQYTESRTAAINAIKEAFDEEGIKIPYPQRELTGRTETNGFQVTTHGAEPPSEESTEGQEHRMTSPEGE